MALSDLGQRLRQNGSLPETGEDLEGVMSGQYTSPATGERSFLFPLISRPQWRPRDENSLEPGKKKQTTLAGLYNFAEASSPFLRNGVNLANESINILNQAKDALDANDAIMAQDAVTRLRPVFMELFCCRKIGDGFGEIVRACQTAVFKFGDDTPSLEQIAELRWALNRLQKEPFISFDDAIEYVINMENAGLIVDESRVTELLPADNE